MNRIGNYIQQRIARPRFGFGSPEKHSPMVYGARRPGFPFNPVSGEAVAAWIAYMQNHAIRRVVCLLPPSQLEGYDDLLGYYRGAFGEANLCWAPIHDFQLASEATLIEQILPFLFHSHAHQSKTVVHCAGGIGRTGHVLAAWLVSARGFTNQEAILAVKRNGRNARESGDPRLDELLDKCRVRFATLSL